MIHRGAATPARGVVIALPSLREPVAEARLVALAPDVAALVFEAPAGHGPLLAFVDGARLDAPLIGTQLLLRAGRRRQVVMVGRPAASLAGHVVLILRDGRPVGGIDPEWLQAPDGEVSDLFEDLADEGALRLLRLLMTTGASLFRSAAPSLGALARRLLDRLALRPLPPQGAHALGANAQLLTWRVPGSLDATRIGELAALTPAGPVRLPRLPIRLERGPDGALLHAWPARRLPPGSLLVATGGARLALDVPARVPGGDLAAFLAARSPATVALTHQLLESHARRDPVAAALVRELRHARAPAPALAARHLSGTPGGVVHVLSLDDPHGLVGGIRLTRGGRSVEVAAAPRVFGYAPLPRSSRIDDRCRLALIYRSGRVVEAGEIALPPFDGRAPAGLTDAEALASSRLDREPAEGRARLEAFGLASAPRLSIVAGLCDDLDLVRARAAVVFAEPSRATVEILYHLADGPDAEAARAAIAHAAAAWGIAHSLVMAPSGASEGERVRMALAFARGRSVLFLDARTLPAARGWLGRAVRDKRVIAMGRAVDHEGLPTGEPGPVRLDASLSHALPEVPGMTPAVLLAALAARNTQGARARTGNESFVRFGGGARPAFERAADAAALRRLKGSFSLGCEESGS